MENLNFEIEHNSKFGRYAKSALNFRPGSILHEELPFVVGPKCDSAALCLECYVPLNGSKGGPRCDRCGWPICSKCKGSGKIESHLAECEIFRESGAKFQNLPEPNSECLQMDCVMPLRLLLKKEAIPKLWEREVGPMEHHSEARSKTEYWLVDEINVVKYLRGPCKLQDRFSAEDIQRAIGVLEVNTFEARTVHGHPLRCLYTKFGVVAHSCVPNTCHSIVPSEGFKLQVRASVDIAKGEIIYASYTFTISTTALRQEHLRRCKYFTCTCQRCLDPTELGTHFSTFRCSRCDSGFVVADDPLKAKSLYSCASCGSQRDGNDVERSVQLMQKEIEETSNLPPSRRIEELENLHEAYRKVVHQQHFIMYTIRYNLMNCYGRIPGFLIDELSEEGLNRKIELCRDLLAIQSIFEPGKVRLRALILYELYSPLLKLAEIHFEEAKVGQDMFENLIKKAADVLRECIEILEMEDPLSKEGSLGRIARQVLNSLEDGNLSSIGF